MRGISVAVRRAVRRLLRAPAFTIPVVLTLGLGIGVAAAVYTLVETVLMRPLPYPGADRIVTLRHTAPGLGITTIGQSAGTYVHYREHNRSFAEIGTYWDREYTITDGDVPERIQAAIVTPSIFSVLNVPPLLGEWLSSTEEARTVAISHALWLRRYGGDSAVIGRTIEINRSPHRIVGVMPPGFAFPGPETQLWYANPMRQARRAGIGVHDMFMTTIARLRPGVSPEAAARDIDRMIPGLSEAYADAPVELLRRAQLQATVMPLKDALVQDIRPVLLLLGAAALVVLLIVWANATTLVLLRAERQQQAIAVERALGATSGDLARQCLAETGALAVAGGLGGLLVAAAAVSTRLGFGEAHVPRLDDLRLEEPMVVVVVALTALTAAVLGAFSLARAFRLRGSGSPLRAASRMTAGRERLRVQRLLVAGQMALALALLVVSAALGRSFLQLTRVDLGFDPAGVVTLETALPVGTYSTYHSEVSFYTQVLEQLRAMPGVTAAEAVQSGIPLTPIDEFTNDALAPAQAGLSGTTPDTTAASTAIASPGYFAAMRIPLVQGRTFAPGDLVGAHHGVVVSASLARDLFPDGSALNRRLRFGASNRTELPAYTIVGIVGDVPGEAIADGPSKRLYLPMLEDFHAIPDSVAPIPYYPFEMSLVVRTELPTATVAATVRRIVHSLDPKVPVWGERTLPSIVTSSMAQVRLTTFLFLVAASAALALGVIGIYGVISYAVGQRTHELGVRLALGASPAMITQMVVRDGVRIALVGIVGGLLAAALLTRLLRALLYQVSPNDPLAFVLMPAVLLALALLGAYLPARRAGRTDPVSALKAD